MCSLRPDVHEQLLAWHDQGYTGKAIRDGIEERFGKAETPHLNTVYAEVKKHAAGPGAWTLADESFSHEEARLVLTELAAVYHLSNGKRRHFTKREAWWIARLKLVGDGFEPGEAFRMAQSHVEAERRGEQLSPWLDTIEVGPASLHVHLGHRELYAPKETK